MTLYNVGTLHAVQLIRGGDGPTLIINRDTANTLYIGQDNGVASRVNQNSDVSVIDPLGSMSFAGNIDIWGISAVGTIIIDVQSDALVWAPSPAQIAQQISQLSTVLLNTGNKTIAANSTVVLGTVNVTLPGYDVSIQSVWNAAIADGLNLRMYMQWQDAATGIVYDNQEWQIGGALHGTTPINIVGSGPTQGNQVVISVRNTSATVAATVNFSLLQNSRNYTRDNWQWSNFSQISVPGYTMASDSANTGITGDNLTLGEVSGATIPAAGFTTFLCSLTSGVVRWNYFESSNNLIPEEFEVTFYAPFKLDTGGRILTMEDIRDLSGNGDFFVPRTPIMVVASNKNASQTATFSMHLVSGS